MPNFRSAGAEIFDSEKGIGRKENRAAGAKKRPSVIAGLIFLTSYSALSRISRDPRVKPEDDKEEKKVLEDGRREKSPRMTIIYLSFPCLTRESVREILGSSPRMTGEERGRT